MKKVACVLSTGCPESRIDSARVQNFLRENGWIITNDVKNADLILFRTCGLTETKTNDSLQTIKKIKAEKKENAKFIAWGCLPNIDPEALKTEYDGVTFGEKEITTLNDILEPKKKIEEVTANYLMPVFESKQSGFHGCLRKLHDLTQEHFDICQNESIFQIKVSTGCFGNCSFCAVRKSRGTLHSKTIDCVLSEFKDGLDKGFRYFGLLATDLGAYGRDRGHNLVDLLTEMTKVNGDYKIGLRNVNPYYLNEMFEELKPILASQKIWFLSSAAETGSNRILKLMHRRYSIQEFERCIKTLNKEYPHIFLRTQMMVGFPTETEEDFQKSIHLIDELKFDWVEVYKYSPRSGTLAATMSGQLPEKIKETRFLKLTLKALTQRPHLKMKQILQSYLKS